MTDASKPDPSLGISTSPEDVKPKVPPKPESALKSFLSGGFGGVCIVLVGHPLDLVKVRMQTGAVQGSVLGVLVKNFRAEGIPGLYRGVAAPLAAITPMYAVNFWGYDMGQRAVRWWNGILPGGSLTIGQLSVAGGLSAIPATTIMAPSERVKCLLQVPNHPYNGMVDCGSKLLRMGGIQSLYKGTALTLMRDIPASMAWFGTYELVKKEMMRMQGIDPATGALSPLAIVSAGGFAGMSCWCVAIPMDTLKSRYQSAPEGKYKGIVDVYSQLMKSEGPSALFTGIRPALIRAFPANAACFMGMELARKALSFMD